MILVVLNMPHIMKLHVLIDRARDVTAEPCVRHADSFDAKEVLATGGCPLHETTEESLVHEIVDKVALDGVAVFYPHGLLEHLEELRFQSPMVLRRKNESLH